MNFSLWKNCIILNWTGSRKWTKDNKKQGTVFLCKIIQEIQWSKWSVFFVYIKYHKNFQLETQFSKYDYLAYLMD